MAVGVGWGWLLGGWLGVGESERVDDGARASTGQFRPTLTPQPTNQPTNRPTNRPNRPPRRLTLRYMLGHSPLNWYGRISTTLDRSGMKKALKSALPWTPTCWGGGVFYQLVVGWCFLWDPETPLSLSWAPTCPETQALPAPLHLPSNPPARRRATPSLNPYSGPSQTRGARTRCRASWGRCWAP